MPLNPISGDRSPYAFMFIGAAVATVLAGWRSGVIAVVFGQLLTWYLIILPVWSYRMPDSQVQAGLVIATVSQLIMVLILGLYQREIDKGVQEREKRLELLDHALREIDHRTANNYQTVLALIDLQARRDTDPNTRGALAQVRDRIQAIANASRQLAVNSEQLEEVRLDQHLCGLVAQIERGLARDGIEVDCEVEEVTANAETATSISIIVNELVTNAIKHAFNGEGSGHVRVTGKAGNSFEIIVADDGRGIEASRKDGHAGLGTKLVESFTRQLNARHDVVSTANGTEHRLTIPRLS